MIEVQQAFPLLPRVNVTGNLWQSLSPNYFAGNTVDLMSCAWISSRIRGYCWWAAAGSGLWDPPAAAQQHSCQFSMLLLEINLTGMSATTLQVFSRVYPRKKCRCSPANHFLFPVTGFCGKDSRFLSAKLKHIATIIFFPSHNASRACLFLTQEMMKQSLLSEGVVPSLVQDA